MKRLEKTLNILYILSGGFFVAVYVPYFIWHTIKNHPADILASLLVFGAVLLPVFFRKKLKKLLKKAYLPMESLWCLLMCFYMITFSIFSIVLQHSNRQNIEDPNGKQEVVLIFGCQVNPDGQPSLELQKRIEKAAEVLQNRPDALVVATGGKGDKEPLSEGETIRNVLISQYGIPKDKILVEKTSKNTKENIRFAIEVLKKEGYSREDCAFIAVSSAFHTPRIQLLFHRNGVENLSVASSPPGHPALLFLYTVREYMSYVHLFLFGI